MDAQTKKDFVMSRVFDAPRDLLWKCFTEPERMKQWWGPKGFTVIAATMDLRVGGTYHYGMTAPNGSTMWGLFTYREICHGRNWYSSTRSRMKKAVSPAIPATRNGR